MKTYAIKMYFNTPLHIGEQGLGMEEADTIIHSDTLYSAIHHTWLKFELVNSPLPITISSAYPFVDHTYYLPKPGLEPPGFDNTEIRESYAKSVKSTAFLSHNTFKKWISREAVDYTGMEAESQLLAKHISNTVRPRVKIDRINSQTALYFVGEVTFTRGRAGLYFIVRCMEDVYKKLQVVMRVLADEGLGGERSSGYGRFDVQFMENFMIPEVNNGSKYVSISLYYPASEKEFKGAMESYQLYRRGGWTTGEDVNYPHKRVTMFSEGSVFNKKVTGTVIDVSPAGVKHPVYRYGKAFLVQTR
jgi:CRISPR-associated protein Csm4